MNKKMGILVLLVAAVILTGYSVSGTYAKYTSSQDVAGSAQVAKWSIKFGKDNAGTLSETTSFDLGVTADNDNTITNGKLAPGTTGSFTIGLDSTGTEVAYEYSITFGVENKPSNLEFYTDNTYNTRIVPAAGVYTLNNNTQVALDAQGYKNVTVYWKWNYENTTSPDGERTTLIANDGADTTNGETAEEMRVTATLTATQLNEVA